MDIDSFLAANRPAWDRLEQLTGRANRSVERLSAAELDELVGLYQRVSTHLSLVRTTFSDAGLTARLSVLVAGAGTVVYGTRSTLWRSLGRFFSQTFPGAVWHMRWFLAVSAALTLVPGLALGLWLAHSPAAVRAVAPPALRQAYVHHDFAAYYISTPAAQFATHVFTNNVEVAVMAFALGIFGCVLTAGLLAFNGANLGLAAGLFASAGAAPRFWGLVLPHGLIELTSVVIAGAAGLRLGWTVIDPGDRPRALALAQEGRRTVVLVLGVVLSLAVAGTIEGFVTGSSLPTVVRVGLGVAVELAFVTYLAVCGRAAALQGLTGALGEAPPARSVANLPLRPSRGDRSSARSHPAGTGRCLPPPRRPVARTAQARRPGPA